MKRLIKIFLGFSAIAEMLAVVSIYMLFVLILVETLLRSFFNYSLPFSWEYGAYLMAAVMFFGMSSALVNDNHIRVKIVFGFLNGKSEKIFDMVITLVAAFISSIMIYSGWSLVGRSYKREIVSNTIMETPLYVPQSIILFGSILLALSFLVRVAIIYLREEND